MVEFEWKVCTPLSDVSVVTNVIISIHYSAKQQSLIAMHAVAHITLIGM